MKEKQINIKVTPEEHQRLKVAAAQTGKTYRDMIFTGLEAIERTHQEQKEAQAEDIKI